MITKLLSLPDEFTGKRLSFYHKNKGEEVVLFLLKPLKNRKVLAVILILLTLLSVWYYFH
ncbi:hypothetical protein EWM59_16630 [Emticicia agri]|uniref:Uncharacterized protein n=1 Tax=Emticicia agri TaxID=2492393 RepID=A0A4Q5LXE9_9BACT|nr:hypothetical protein EWM59_16630 [Emticicia agri]